MKTELHKTFCMALALLAFATIASAEKKDNGDPGNLHLSYNEKLPPGHAIATINVEGKALPIGMDTCATHWLSLFTPTCQALGAEVIQNERGLNIAEVRVGLDAEGTLSPPRKVLVADAPNQLPLAGVMGWAAISKKIWDVDYPKQRQTFHKTLPKDVVKGWTSFPIVEVPMRVLVIEMPIDGKKQQVFIDTGAFAGVGLNPDNWERWHAEAKPDWVTVQAAYSPANKNGFEVSKTAVAERYMLGELDLGRVRVSDMQEALALSGEVIDIQILLGFNAFRQRRVIIDGPGQRMYFGPLTEPAEDDSLPSINRAQATFIPPSLEGGDMLAHVIEGGVAHQAGLRNGDKVLMVDGNMTRNWQTDTSVRPTEVFNRAPGTRVRLLVERDGERFPITFELGRSPVDPPTKDKE